MKARSYFGFIGLQMTDKMDDRPFRETISFGLHLLDIVFPKNA